MKKYKKIINGKTVILPRNKIVVIKDKKQIVNPSEITLLNDGWEIYKPLVSTTPEVDPVDLALGELNNSDYKIIKCMEAFLCGEPLPYDINTLHTERERFRDTINKLSK